MVSFLPSLTFNELFLQSFLNEEAPCAALGIVEVSKQEKGFIALKADEVVDDYERGFELGTQLLGNDRFAMLNLVFNFRDNNVYDVLLDLGAPATKRVLRAWEETGDYFFFVIREGSLNGFHNTIGSEWYEYDYFEVMANANTTESQYYSVVRAFHRKNSGRGTYLNLHYQYNTGFLDLKDNRFEARPMR